MDKDIKKTLVSIILPVYNVGEYIEIAINSVLRQSYTNFELIIIDDGSNDNTVEIIKKINNDKIKFYKNSQNIGLQKTLNKALEISSGEYIARIDGDDEWIDNKKLEKQINFLKEKPDYSLIGTGAVCINEKKEYLYKYLKPQTNNKIKKTLLGYNCFIHSSVVFRSKDIEKIDGYSEKEEHKHIEDYELWLKLGKIGKLYNLPEYSINYMIRNSSVGNKNLITQLKKTIKIAKRYKKYYPKNRVVNMIRNYLRLLYFGYLK